MVPDVASTACQAAKTHGTDGTVQKAPANSPRTSEKAAVQHGAASKAESGQSDVEDSYGADDFEESARTSGITWLASSHGLAWSLEVDEASMSEDKAGGDK